MVQEEEKKVSKKNKEKGRDYSWIGFIAMVIAIFGLMVILSSAEDYDNLVTLNQGAKSNESIYREMVAQIGQEVEVIWEPYITYLPHESKTIIEAMKYRAAYNNAVNEGNTIEALKNAQTLNTVLQVKALSVTEASPQQLVSAKLAEQTQLELKDSVSKLNSSFIGWTENVKGYNVARNQISGKLAVLIWGRILGTNLPEELSYYKFEKTELNVTETVSKR